MLSNTCKYAIRAVLYLGFHARDEQKIGIKKISEDLKIPTPFLGKILQQLAKQKLLISTKGPNGGFALGKDPSKITLMDIVEIIDGKDLFENCLISMRKCNERSGHCAVHNRYAQIREDIRDMFRSHKLADLIHDMKHSADKIVI